MAMVVSIIGGITGLIGLICYILVIIKMFQHGQTGLAITSIVLFCCIFGYFIAFIYGWMKPREWAITNIMTIWSVCVVVSLIINAAYPPKFDQFQQQFQNQPVR